MEESKHAKFITFEGLEGAGKSTCIQFACDVLAEHNIPFVLTREPGGTLIAEQLRDILLHQEHESVTAMTELLLMFAARSQHIEHVIRKALDQGKWVVCDRFTDATYAYQGVGREMGAKTVTILEDMVQGELRPDLTVVLDVSYEVGMSRVEGRGAKDRFEKESEAFFNRVRRGYHDRIDACPERYQLVNAEHHIDTVEKDVKTVIRALLEQSEPVHV